MLVKSQPLSPNTVEKLIERGKIELPGDDAPITISQCMGMMFSDIDEKATVIDRAKWFFTRRLKDGYYNTKHTIRNHIKWHKTMREIRSWDGDRGMILCMVTHLHDYIDVEEKYGSAEESYKAEKIASAKEAVAILERMSDPHGYSFRRRDEVDAQYPEYAYLISKTNTGTCYSGDFIRQGIGWTGIESGSTPREGYFEKVGELFEVVESPNQAETDRLLEEIRQYRIDMTAAYQQAQADSDEDFDRLAELFKKHLYSWWD
jgi:hypothetical protein